MPAAGDIWPATGILPRLIAVAGDARFDVHLAGLDEGTGNNVGRVGPADVGAQKKPAGEEGDKFFHGQTFRVARRPGDIPGRHIPTGSKKKSTGAVTRSWPLQRQVRAARRLQKHPDSGGFENPHLDVKAGRRRHIHQRIEREEVDLSNSDTLETA